MFWKALLTVKEGAAESPIYNNKPSPEEKAYVPIVLTELGNFTVMDLNPPKHCCGISVNEDYEKSRSSGFEDGFVLAVPKD